MTRMILASALGLAAIAGAAHAQTFPSDSWDPPAHRTVRSSDLNLATAEGARRMAFRIRVAAQDLCQMNLPEVRTGSGFQVCVARAIDRAATDLDAPLVTAALGVQASPGALVRQ